MRNRKESRMHAGLRGRLKWRVEDAHGRVKTRGECENLITDAGLNLLASHGIRSGGVLTWLRVGTDSTTPAVSDTSLGSQVGAASETIGSANMAVPSEGLATVEQEVDFGIGGATGNLTEFGASHGETDTLFSRALFRDGNGDPVPVPVASDEKLVLTYTLEITLSHTPSAAGATTVDITGIGSNLGISYAWVVGNVASNLLNVISDLMAGFGVHMHVWPSQGMAAWPNFTDAVDETTISADAYVTDSHERTYADAVWETADANRTHYGYLLSAGGANQDREGLLSVFDNGDEFTKADTHELTITPPKVSWGRA